MTMNKPRPIFWPLWPLSSSTPFATSDAWLTRGMPVIALLLMTACVPVADLSPTDADKKPMTPTASDDGADRDEADCTNPAPEVCDGLDNDCDGLIDEDARDRTAWFLDADGDGHGDDSESVLSCSAPDGYVADNTDCDDSDSTEHPGADEVCDGDDDNCDGVVDEDTAIDVATWYKDSDGDGYGSGAVSDIDCNPIDGYVADNTDCDDSDSTEYPGADEICDGDDDNCDGVVDEDTAIDVATWYKDSDRDGFGNGAISDIECYPIDGYVADNTDCDDEDSMEHPGADEICDGHDNNCDGVVDEDTAIDVATWYKDGDRDGYGDASEHSISCREPDGYVAALGDCDDDNPDAYPGAEETCRNSIDLNCDGEVEFIPLPTTCEVHLVQQGRFTDLDLSGSGLVASSVSLSGYALQAHSGRDIVWPPSERGWDSSFQGLDRERIESTFANYLEEKFGGPEGIPEGTVIMLDMEHPVHPRMFREYMDDPELFASIIDAFKLRIDVAREALPDHPLALYGIVVPHSRGSDDGFSDTRAAYVAAGELGLYDDIDYLVPVLYHRWGEDDRDRAERADAQVYQGLIESAALQRTDGTSLPLFALVNLRVANGGSLNHGDAPEPEWQDAVIEGVLEHEAVEIIGFWTGSDTHAESVIEEYGNLLTYFESVSMLPIPDCTCPVDE